MQARLRWVDVRAALHYSAQVTCKVAAVPESPQCCVARNKQRTPHTSKKKKKMLRVAQQPCSGGVHDSARFKSLLNYFPRSLHYLLAPLATCDMTPALSALPTGPSSNL